MADWSARRWRAGHARRGGHRHGQDLRLSRAGAAVRPAGHRLHRHQDAAGPALPPRPADGAQALGRRCAALLKGRANYLCLHRLEIPRWAALPGMPTPTSDAASRISPGVAHDGDRRPRRGQEPAGFGPGLGRRDLDARKLPRGRARGIALPSSWPRGARRRPPTSSSSTITCCSPTSRSRTRGSANCCRRARP